MLGVNLAAQEVIPDFYRDPGLNPNRSYVNQSFNEHIDPFTGSLQQHYVDLHIPGNGGFDLKVVRSYNSASVDPQIPATYESLTGVGWTIHFGRVLKKNNAICSNSNALTVSDNPVLELPDGGRQMLAFTGGTSPLMLTTQRWRADCILSGSGGLKVYSPDGTQYDMTQMANVGIGSPIYAWFTTKITDRNGNFATISYASVASPEITGITTSDGRSISFTYHPLQSGELNRRISSISGAGQTYTYGYQAISNVTGKYQLTTVTRPGGTSWQYGYNGNLNTSAGSYVMSQTTYPQGGTITYGYGFAYFDAQANPNYKSTVVSSKSRSGGGNWTFAYNPGGPGSLDTTTITTPSGTEVYRHIGPNYVSSGTVWTVGLLKSKTIGSLHTETYTWDKQKISSENFLRPGVFNLKVDMGETNASILTQRTVERDGATYTTTYSGFDTYGNPASVAEAGTSGGNRTTSLTYNINTTKWIVNQLKNESFSGSSVTRNFDGDGNMISITRDGVTTTHSFDSQGNVASTTFPRSFIHNYSNYRRGIPQSENQPEGVSITRVVSDAGNVTSETNGEGRTTGYGYDGLNRVTSIDYPTGTSVTISYGSASKTATRGALTEATIYNGFGQPTSVSLGGISRTFQLDAFGRKTFESDPGSGSGTTYEYDILNRVKKVTNADSTSQTISYGSGSKAVTDERSRTTTFTYRTYGNPDQQFLMSINAPEASASVTIQRNSRDLATQVTQAGLTRQYGYYSNYYLQSVTNPETGTTSYGRDAAGNMTSRSVGSSGTTNYTYDNQNRLSLVTYPGSTPSVTNTYNKIHKLLSATSSTGTRSFGYDGNGNLTSESLVVDGLTFAATYTYNSLDQLSSITYPRSNTTVNYAPDTLGRPTQVSGYVNSVSYWPSGQINQISYANGTTSSYGQNSRLWPSNFSTQRGGTTYISSGYTYDGAGNLTNINDSVDDTYDRTLSYDGINRLSTVSGPWGSGAINYNGAGNITSQVFGASSLNYTYDGSNRLSSVSGSRNATYGYDAYGNIVSGSGTAYTYDGAPNLRCFNCADTVNKIEYAYDATNHRSVITKGGVKTYEMYGANGNLLMEFTPSSYNHMVEHIYLGGKRIASKTSSVNPPLPTLAVNRTTLMSGLGYTLTWTSTNATEVSYNCTASGTGYVGKSGALAPNGSSAGVASALWVGFPSSCTWTATGPGGIKTLVETMTTVAPAVPTLIVSRNPSPLVAGQGYTLTWASTGASEVSYTCTAGGTGYIGNSGPLVANGNSSGVALAAWIGYSSTCTWTATGPGGNKTVNETMTTVAPTPPSLTVQRNPSPMTAGKNYMLTWSSTNATSVSYTCSALNTGYVGSGTVAPNGSTNGTASNQWIGYPSTCVWTATGPGGNKTVNETMTTVAPIPPTLTVNLTPSPAVAGRTYTLTWASTNATAVSYVCTASGAGYSGSSGALAPSGSTMGTASSQWIGNPSTCTWTATGPDGDKSVIQTFGTINNLDWLPAVIFLLLDE